MAKGQVRTSAPTSPVVHPTGTSGVPAVVDETFTGMELSQEMPSWLEPSNEGTEDISNAEVTLPRLGIAQGLSPQMLPDKSEYIDGLRLGDLFNDLTGQRFGRGPVHFVVARRDVKRIEFKPRKDGGGVVDMDVPVGDPRLEWRRDPSGDRTKDEPPVATTFNEFTVLLFYVDEGRPVVEPCVISIKDTNKHNRKASQRLIALLKQPYRGRPVPIFARVFTCETVMESNDKGTFGVYRISHAGFAPKKIVDAAQSFRKSLEGKVINVNRDFADAGEEAVSSREREPGEDDM